MTELYQNWHKRLKMMISNKSLNQLKFSAYSEYMFWSQRTEIRYNMYGEAFYGFHTAQRQLQWSKHNSFKSRNYIQNEKHGPYFEVSAIQASSVTLTYSGGENQRQTSLTSHHQRGHTEAGPWFKVSSERPEKRQIDLAIDRHGDFMNQWTRFSC